VKFRELLQKWSLTGLKIKLPFLDADWAPKDPDKDAAWELYVELLTRITTQALATDHGDEKTALDSVHALFGITRDILKRHGKYGTAFAKLAIPVLNQYVRPFTAKWHRLCTQGKFADPRYCLEFRHELAELQVRLRLYTRALAELAGVEDLTDLEGLD